MPTAVGILGAGALSAGSGLLSAGISASASRRASQQQMLMGMLGMNQQMQMFQQAEGALSPYYTAGANILPTLQALISPSTAASTLQNLPGFQFASKWGNLQAQNALAAQGLGGSAGPVSKAIADYSTGLAQTYWGQDVSALQNFANMGSNAASALGGVASNFANTIGNTTTGLGNAAASGILGAANAQAGGINALTGGLGNAALLSALSPNSTSLGGMGNSLTNTLGGIYGSVTGERFLPYG